MLEEMGIPVEHGQHEDAPSQHEIDLRYTDALTMADTVMTVRMVVKEMAASKGVHASFMPKPLAGVQGSGMHTHVSLWTASATPSTTTTTVRAVAGGPAVHRRRCCATPARSPRSPTSGSTPTSAWSSATRRRCTSRWARNNRSALVRVPPIKKGKGESTRHRVPGARQRVQPVPGVRRGPGRRADAGSRRATSCPPRRTPTSSSCRRRSGWPRGSSRCRSSL